MEGSLPAGAEIVPLESEMLLVSCAAVAGAAFLLSPTFVSVVLARPRCHALYLLTVSSLLACVPAGLVLTHGLL
jgi:hypothetical protein